MSTSQDYIAGISPELIERFRENETQTLEDILVKHWRSIVCMTCGACCCSSLVPISDADFSAFHERLGIVAGREKFADMFLQHEGENAAMNHIETERYGGRCMFLAKDAYFECRVWGIRAGVCEEFYCWDMAHFITMRDGGEQDVFDPAATFTANIEKLMDNLVRNSPLSVFDDEMAGYMRLRRERGKPAWSDIHPELFRESL